MRDRKTVFFRVLTGTLLAVAAGAAAAQKPPEPMGRMTIQATAMGTSTQMGRMANINIYIEQLSTDDDQKTLLEAFKRNGQDGMVKVLEDMKPKGRVRFSSGGVGNDVKYIKELPSDKGRRFRLVTDRNIGFAEQYAMTRSEQYNVGAIELTIMPDGTGSGTVLPAVRLTVNKKTKQVEVETYQFPWKLSNFNVTKE